MGDLRTIRTYKLLKDSLLELLSKDSFDNIKVNDICNLAMVHRTTFYSHFADKYELLDYAIKDIENDLISDFSKNKFDTAKDFYTALENTNVYFLMNEEKNGIKGYIGSSSIAELTYAVILNLIHNKNIEIYILNMPSEEVSSYDEVKFWLNMGWIKIYDSEKCTSGGKNE